MKKSSQIEEKEDLKDLESCLYEEFNNSEQEKLTVDNFFSPNSYKYKIFDDDNAYEPIDRKVGDELQT